MLLRTATDKSVKIRPDKNNHLNRKLLLKFINIFRFFMQSFRHAELTKATANKWP